MEYNRRFDVALVVIPVLVFFQLVWCVLETEGATNETVTSRLRERCRGDVQKLRECLEYATDKEDEPSEACCRSVDEMRNSSPECLCYLILKANCVQPAIFGITFSLKRFVDLPNACRLTGPHSIALCPDLLRIPEDSPDRAIFNGSDPSRKSTECEANSAFRIRFSSAGRLALAVSSAIFSSIFAF